MNKRSKLSQERIKFLVFVFWFFFLMHSYEKQINLWVFEEFTVTMVQLKNKQLLLQVEHPEMSRFILLALRIPRCVVLALKSHANIAHPQQPGRAEGTGLHMGVAGLGFFSSAAKQGLDYAIGLFILSAVRFEFFLAMIQWKRERQKRKAINYKVFTVTTMKKKFVENGETLLYLTQSRNSVRLTAAWSSFLHVTWRK